MSSRTCLMSAVLLLLVGTATARYYENNVYSDADCEDLVTRAIIDGVPGDLDTIEVFNECTDLSSLGQAYSSGMHECTDNEVVKNYYASEDCSGDVYQTMTTSSDCTSMQTTSCTEEVTVTMLSDWVASATYYSDENCTTATGVTSEYTMAEVLAARETETCQESGSDSSSAHYETLRCIDGAVGDVSYGESDTTCSDDFTIAVVMSFGCFESIFDDGGGDYMTLACATDFDGASSLLAAGGRGAAFAWSVAAATAATVLAAVFG